MDAFRTVKKFVCSPFKKVETEHNFTPLFKEESHTSSSASSITDKGLDKDIMSSSPSNLQSHQNVTPLGAVFTLLSAADAKHNSATLERAIEQGFRLRKCIKDPQQTVASFAKDFVERQYAFLLSMCKEVAGDMPCNLILQYGNGTSTTIMLRYEEETNEAALKSTLRIVVKLVENKLVSIIHADDSLYEQMESSALHPRELYISTSKMILDPSDALVTDEAGSGQNLNSTILMIVKKADGEFKSINASPNSAQIKEFYEGMDPPSAPSSKKSSAKPSATAASSSKVTTKAPTPVKNKSKKPESKQDTPKPKSPKGDKKRKDSTPTTKEDTQQAKKAKLTTPSIEDIDESVKVPTKYALFCADHKEGDQLAVFGTNKPSTREFRIAYERLSKEELKEYDEKVIALKMQGTIDKNKGLVAPKHPKTSYNLFCDDVKKKFLADDPNARPPDGKVLGAKFKEISKEDKQKYDADAAALRKKYNDEMAEFKKKKGNGEEEVSNDKKRKQRDSDTPARPLTSFMLFCGDFRKEVKKENPKAGARDIAEILGKKYIELGKEDKEVKEKYEQRARDLMKKYREDLGDNDQKDGNGKIETKSTSKSKKRKNKKKDPNAPKRPLSSFMLFCADNRKDINKKNPNLGPNDVAKLLGEKYRALSKKKLESYKKQAEKQKTKYGKEMEKYKKTKNDAEGSAKGGEDEKEDGKTLVI